jgi:hypothetical protein
MNWIKLKDRTPDFRRDTVTGKREARFGPQGRDIPARNHGPHARPRPPRSARLLQLGPVPSQRDTLRGDGFPDDLPVRSLCRRMVCTVCGMIGADVRPDWSPHANKRHV